MADQDRDEDIKRVKLAVANLMEHFESVQVFATRLEHEGTVNVNWGAGNWFARYGQVTHWINTTDMMDGERAVRGMDEDD